MESVLAMVTDECGGGSKSTNLSGPCGTAADETSEKSDNPRSTGSNGNRFEVEPGHFDFMHVMEYSSRQFSSDSGSAKGGSNKGDSSTSVRRRSNQSASTSSSRGQPKLSDFMSDWMIQPQSGSTADQEEMLALEFSSEAARQELLLKPSVPQVNRAAVVQPVKHAVAQPVKHAVAQPVKHAVAQPVKPAVAQRVKPAGAKGHPFLANFTWAQVAAMTSASNNQELGRGGFGPVYMGILPNKKKVAVKILANGSRQGDSEFINEVNLLSRVNHVNLVKLVGFCKEGNDRVLVYEHAEQGTLWDHIHGKLCPLDWKTRLKVSLESACGLEYLHTGCTEKIIHRDIKSSNILLTKNLVAKVADFGLSKIGFEDENENQTHISTVVKGTPGYLDPEYYKSGQLNDKSDIYSFGVVLLETITGRNPIDKNAEIKFIGDWVKAHWKSFGGAKGVADPSLNGAYNVKSMRAVVTLALKCIELAAKNRPDVRVVVEQLRAAIVLEDNTLQVSKWSLRSLLGQA